MFLTPLLIRAAGVGLVIGALGSGVAWWTHHQRDIGRAEVQAKWDAANEAAARATFKDTERRFKESQNAQDNHASELRRVAVSRDTARTERERLRDELDSLSERLATATDAEPACEPDAGSATAVELFRESSERYEAMAAEAGELAATLVGLQSWVSGVCGNPVNENVRWDR